MATDVTRGKGVGPAGGGMSDVQEGHGQGPIQ